jgi:hypothetical protein
MQNHEQLIADFRQKHREAIGSLETTKMKVSRAASS